MTNADVFKGFSQYLDGHFIFDKDTSDKEQMLNDYLRSVNLSPLILLSKETKWHFETAYQAHIERINTASFTEPMENDAMTNEDLFSLFSQHLDGHYLLGKDTSNKDSVLNDFLNIIGNDEIDTSSDEAKWFLDTAYDTHIERINTATITEPRINHYFGVKPLGDNAETLHNAFVLPRDKAVQAYRELDKKYGGKTALRDIDPNSTHFFRVENVEETTDERLNIKLYLFAADNYTNAVALRGLINSTVKDINKYSVDARDFKVENKTGEFGNRIQVISFNAQDFELKQDFIIGELNGSRMVYEQEFEDLHISEPEFNEHAYDESAHKNPHRPNYATTFQTKERDVIDDDHIDDEIDALFDVDSLKEDSDELANKATGIEEKTEQTPVDEITDAASDSLETTPNQTTMLSDNVTETVNTSVEDDDMNKTLFVVDGLSDDLVNNAFAYALNEMNVNGQLEGIRRADTLDFLKQQGYDYKAHYLSSEQNQQLQNIYQHFIDNRDINKTNIDDVKEKEIDSVQSDAVSNNTKIDNNDVTPNPSQEQTETVTTSKTPETTTEDTSEQVNEKTIFHVEKLDELEPRKTGFYAWLKDQYYNDNMNTNMMFNIGFYYKSIGFDPEKNTYVKAQVTQLKHIHQLFNDAVFALNTSASEAIEEEANNSESEKHDDGHAMDTSLTYQELKDYLLDVFKLQVADKKTNWIHSHATELNGYVVNGAGRYGIVDKDGKNVNLLPNTVTTSNEFILYEQQMAEQAKRNERLSQEGIIAEQETGASKDAQEQVVEDSASDKTNDASVTDTNSAAPDDDKQSEQRPAFIDKLINSYRCAAALGMFTGDFGKDVHLTLTNNTGTYPLSGFSEKEIKALRDIHEEARVIINLSQENVDDITSAKYFSLSALVDNEFQTMHFLNENDAATFAEVYNENGYQPDIIPISAERLTGRVESISEVKNNTLAVTIALHGPVNTDNFEKLALINNGLGKEISENCLNISGLKLSQEETGSGLTVPVMEIFCENTDFIPHTLLRPVHDGSQVKKSEERLSTEKSSASSPDNKTPTSESHDDNAKVMIYDDTPINFKVKHDTPTDQPINDSKALIDNEPPADTPTINNDVQTEPATEKSINDNAEETPEQAAGFDDDELNSLDDLLDELEDIAPSL